MSFTKWVWVICLAIYAAFFSWYTSFGGPLSDAEIEKYMAYFKSANPEGDVARLQIMRKFMQEDTGDDFVMINVIDMYDTPLQIEGVEPGESSQSVLDKYMQYMYPALFSRASHPVLFGQAANVAMDLMNADGMEQWTQAPECAIAAGGICWKLQPTLSLVALMNSK